MPLKNGKTTASLRTIIVGSVIPAGTIAPFGGGTVPEGWLLCDGSTVSRTTYSALFSAVGTVHGQGNGSSTFHLPDYRGRFLRGADNMGTGAAGRDPNAETRTAANTGGATGSGVGSVQADALQNITGQVATTDDNATTMNARIKAGFTGVFSAVNVTGNPMDSNSVPASQTFPGIIDFDASRVARTSTESRPQNANVEYIIKV
jgi:microcystin-dependent protein